MKGEKLIDGLYSYCVGQYSDLKTAHAHGKVVILSEGKDLNTGSLTEIDRIVDYMQALENKVRKNYSPETRMEWVLCWFDEKSGEMDLAKMLELQANSAAIKH